MSECLKIRYRHQFCRFCTTLKCLTSCLCIACLKCSDVYFINTPMCNKLWPFVYNVSNVQCIPMYIFLYILFYCQCSPTYHPNLSCIHPLLSTLLVTQTMNQHWEIRVECTWHSSHFGCCLLSSPPPTPSPGIFSWTGVCSPTYRSVAATRTPLHSDRIQYIPIKFVMSTSVLKKFHHNSLLSSLMYFFPLHTWPHLYLLPSPLPP